MSRFFDGPMSLTEAAEYLRIAPGTLRNIRSQGRGPRYYAAGGVGILYYREDLDAYVRQFRRDTAESREPERIAEPVGCPPPIKRIRRPRQLKNEAL